MLEFPGLVFWLDNGTQLHIEERYMHVAYILTVWRLSILLIVLPDLVEVIFVELTYETRKVAVFKMFWQDGFGKFLALQQDKATPLSVRR